MTTQMNRPQAASRVWKPIRIASPPSSSIAAMRYPSHVGAGAPPATISMKCLVPALLRIPLTLTTLKYPETRNTADNSTRASNANNSDIVTSLAPRSLEGRTLDLTYVGTPRPPAQSTGGQPAVRNRRESDYLARIQPPLPAQVIPATPPTSRDRARRSRSRDGRCPWPHRKRARR